MNQIKHIRMSIVACLLLLFMIFSIKYQFIDGIKLYGDGIFHVQRILEIRYAFKNLSVPNWLNFYTFFGIGQAINGMYPDFTLWPFVAITNYLSPAHQMAAINFLIFFLTFFVSWMSLRKHQFDFELSFNIAIVYTFSGYCLYQFLNEMQPGVAIINIFIFPIYFVTKDLLTLKKVDITLICKFSLCIILITCSHLLSLVVYAFILGSLVLYLIIRRKLKLSFFVTVLYSIPIIIVGCSPILYRLLVISSSGILTPYGKGHIKAAPIAEMLEFPSWYSRQQLSIASLVLILIVFTFLNVKRKKQILFLITLESYIFLLCLKLFPWRLFDQIPLINNLQYTPWRFGIWLSVIPVIMFGLNFNNYKVNLGIKLSFIFASISIILSITSLTYLISGNVPQLNNNYICEIEDSASNASYSKRTILNMGEHPDYFPNAKNVKNNKYMLTSSRLNQIWEQKIKVENRKIDIKKKTERENGVSYIIKSNSKLENVRVKLPLLCYKSLHYKVKVNDSTVGYSSDSFGNLIIKRAVLNKNDNKIIVEFYNPTVYNYLLIASIVTIVVISLLPEISNRRVAQNG